MVHVMLFLSVVSGITGEVHVNDRKHENWKIYSLEFKPDFIEKYITSHSVYIVHSAHLLVSHSV